MKSMVISTEEKKEMASPSVVRETSKYPYGLKIHLDEDSYKKLGMQGTPTVGQKVMILAQAEICDVHSNKYEGDVAEISVSMQITDMDVKSAEKETSTAEKLYGA